MRVRNLLSVLLLLAGTAAVAKEAAKAPAKTGASAWKIPRTAWGDPDLRGRWPVDFLAQTPRQRPERFGTRAELTDEEYAAATKAADKQRDLYRQEEKNGRMGLGHWTERPGVLRQTSLITQPANGRMPPMTPEGERRAALVRNSFVGPTWQWVDDFNTFDRCITRGLPGSMLPGYYNSGIEIFQAPGYVVIELEMIHEQRIIPLDGRGAPPAAVKGWLGYSRGHWEGDTLVIETSNFLPGVEMGTVGSNPHPVPNSEAEKVTERLTMTGPDSIRYEATIEDPVVLTAPFKLDFPWRRNSDYVIYEYACHEGNVQTRNFITATSPAFADLRAAREKARAAAQAGGSR